MVQVVEDVFGIAVNPLTDKPVKIRRFTMTNKNKFSVSVITRGATVTSIKFPNVNGEVGDVCLGFDTVRDYVTYTDKYIGATLGRVVNRIRGGKYSVNSDDICLTRNLNRRHHYNGGYVGFNSVIWNVCKVRKNGVDMQYCSPADHEGFPGDLTTIIKFTVDESNTLSISIVAQSNEDTAVNISNNILLNLAGHAAGKDSLYEHSVLIKSDNIVDVDREQLPTGVLMPVVNTPYDLRKFSNLGRSIKKFKNCLIYGYDASYCLDAIPGRMDVIAKAVHPGSGRWLEVRSNQPNVQFHTSNKLPDMDTCEMPLIGKNGAIYEKHGAFCFQSQKYPDAVNVARFPTILLKACEPYFHEISYKFGVCKPCKCNK